MRQAHAGLTDDGFKTLCQPPPHSLTGGDVADVKLPSRFRSRLLLLLLLRATFVYEGRRGTLNGQPCAAYTPFIPLFDGRERDCHNVEGRLSEVTTGPRVKANGGETPLPARSGCRA